MIKQNQRLVKKFRTRKKFEEAMVYLKEGMNKTNAAYKAGLHPTHFYTLLRQHELRKKYAHIESIC